MQTGGGHNIICDMIPRIVIDTDVVLSGVISNRGASFQLLKEIASDSFRMLLSVPLFCEYEAKLKHPEMMKQHGLSERDIDRLLNLVVDKATQVSFHFRWRPQLRDANDEMVLETAVNGGARWIVTFNVKDFQRAAPRFGVSLLRPGPFVEMIRGATVKWDNTP